MRFSKKLLTALLPITSAGILVPVLSSCNKGSGYSINFGDTVNCLDEKGSNYHSIDEIKNAVKNHTVTEESSEINNNDLPHWSDSEIMKQQMYFDLIASLSLINSTKFQLKYSATSSETQISLDVVVDGKTTTASGSLLRYRPATGGGTQVDIELGEFHTKSYNFRNTKIVY